MRPRQLTIFAVLAVACLGGAEPAPQPPAAALALLTPRTGFVVEQMATEPLVRDPVAFAWGPDGKFWVVEMGSYPLGADGKGAPAGRVKVLEDNDGDGRYDRATVFLDGLAYPTGVMPWRKGVLVTCAPDILYAEDTDGDRKADVRRALFTGFREGNPQHLVNGLSWGLDNWVYGANGDSGGVVRSAISGVNVNIRGRDFRLNPDTGAFDLQTGQTQFGRCRDDWGNWFGGNNVNPAWHFALEDHHLRRNPHFTPPDPRARVPEGTDLPRVFPLSTTLPRFNDPHTANRFTSACGICFYRDELFGLDFAGSLFVCEPVHNLVSRLAVTAEGSTFRGRRAADERQSEFLASSDNWFRPVFAQTGPDGALWVADMYRHVIEHPEWIPKDWQRRLDLRAGHEQGRIYRVYPKGVRPRTIPRIDTLDTAALVAALDSPNGWQRDMVQQLLVWRQDKSAVPLLEALVASVNRPLARLHALCTLDGLATLRPAVLSQALTDPYAGIRRHAVRLCEPHLAARGELGNQLLRLVADRDTQVHVQLAYTLGTWKDPRTGPALGELAVGAAGDKYLTAAVMSSVNEQNLDGVMQTVLRSASRATRSTALIEELLRLADALHHDKATVLLLNTVAEPVDGRHAPWQVDALAGLLDGLDRRRSSLKQLAERGPEHRTAVARLAGLFSFARRVVADSNELPAQRAAAVRLLARGPDHERDDVDLLGQLLQPQTPTEVQTAAVAAIGRLRDAGAATRLLNGWAGYGPELRHQVMELLARRDDWLREVLAAAERGDLPPTEIDAARRQALLAHRDAAVRTRAEKLFGGAVGRDRQQVINTYQTALSRKGDRARGNELYAKHCATCHKLAGTGGDVGPDLSPLADRPAEYLLTALLDPNRGVEPRYVTYLAETKAGLTLTGVLTGEVGNRLTLVGADGKPIAILRSDLESLTSTGRSLMPDGIEKDLTPQDVVDLFAHVQAAAPGPPRKEFAGNAPAVVKAAADRSLSLTPATAAIYGPTVVLEEKHRNLGHWGSEDDRAVWTVESPAGRYAVRLDWACEDATAGNGLQVIAGDARLRWFVKGTGDWDTYKTERIGEVSLPAGPVRIEVRSHGPIAGWLIDLKEVRLVPAN